MEICYETCYRNRSDCFLRSIRQQQYGGGKGGARTSLVLGRSGGIQTRDVVPEVGRLHAAEFVARDASFASALGGIADFDPGADIEVTSLAVAVRLDFGIAL